jgi:hypothetical protein
MGRKGCNPPWAVVTKNRHCENGEFVVVPCGRANKVPNISQVYQRVGACLGQVYPNKKAAITAASKIGDALKRAYAAHMKIPVWDIDRDPLW